MCQQRKHFKRTMTKWGEPRQLTYRVDNKYKCGKENQTPQHHLTISYGSHFAASFHLQRNFSRQVAAYSFKDEGEKTKVPWGWAKSYCVSLVPSRVPSTYLFKEWRKKWTSLQVFNSLPRITQTGYSQIYLWFGGGARFHFMDTASLFLRVQPWISCCYFNLLTASRFHLLTFQQSSSQRKGRQRTHVFILLKMSWGTQNLSCWYVNKPRR